MCALTMQPTRRQVLYGAAGIGIPAVITASATPSKADSPEWVLTGIQTSGRIEAVDLAIPYICYRFTDGDVAMAELSTTGPEGNTFETDVPASADQWCIKAFDSRTFSGNTGQYRSVLTGDGQVIGRADYRLVEVEQEDDEDWWPFW